MGFGEESEDAFQGVVCDERSSERARPAQLPLQGWVFDQRSNALQCSCALRAVAASVLPRYASVQHGRRCRSQRDNIVIITAAQLTFMEFCAMLIAVYSVVTVKVLNKVDKFELMIGKRFSKRRIII